jgi:hypothetical protein
MRFLSSISTDRHMELNMRLLLSMITVFCVLFLVSAGCKRNTELAELDSGVAAESGAVDVTGGAGGKEATAGMGGKEETGGTGGKEDAGDTDGEDDAGDTGDKEDTGGTGEIAPTDGGETDAAATDSGVEKDAEPVDSGGSTSDNCAKLAQCCDTLRGPSRTDCRNIVELGVDEGCKGFIPTYCTTADGGTVEDSGVAASCEELSVCCDKQTNAMFKSICEAAVSMNNEDTCSLLLTLDLPMGVPCN